MTTQAIIDPPRRPATVPGYQLVERIGLGGYGEVWKAIDLHGRPKAIKFIYGQVNDERAARELKSLSRLSAVSHPFLLAIERMDVCDGQLFIVSELADSSLRDEYDRCRALGLPGIPREKLLGYLAEAAQALDFMYEKLSVQHLDVKPDNILLLGGHAKVADFGLVKSVCDRGASLVNGLTPKYASPDVFEGAPTRYSDQYSLAVMYQELVCGQLPFNGTTVAHLASQHLHAAPDVSCLEPRDRFAVAKALSKEPQRRFASCQEFIERLAKKPSARIAFPDAQRRDGCNVHKPFSPAMARSAEGHDGRTMVVSSPQIRHLPVPQVDLSQAAYRPAVFIGLGGSGGDVLRALRRQLADRFHDAAGIPALAMLYLDTDVRAINAAVEPGAGGCLAQDEVLLLPLDNAQAYRTRIVGQVNSLSRRWLYNIPKSLRTEGLRAVGRIALLDHAERVLQRLRACFTSVSDRQCLETSGQLTGLNFADYNPRVFIISSLSGGTGSGMLVDVAYAARQALAELGLGDEDVTGILTFGRMRGAATARLAVANAYACLHELGTFGASEHHYPGEPMCGLAAFEEARGPFKHTYVVELGMDLTQEQSADWTNRLAEYLLLSSLSPASLVMDACRDANACQAAASQSLRTCGLSHAGDASAIAPSLVDALCQAVIRHWRGGMDEAPGRDAIRVTQVDRIIDDPTRHQVLSNFLDGVAKARLSELGLDLSALAQRASEIVARHLECEPQKYFRALARQLIQKSGFSDAAACWARAIEIVDSIIGPDNQHERETSSASKVESLREILRPAAAEQGRSQGQALASWALGLVDDPALRLGGARRTASAVAHALLRLSEEGAAELKRAQGAQPLFLQETAALLGNPKTARKLTPELLGELVEQYALLRLQEILLEAVANILASVEGHLTGAVDELREYWSNLNRLAEQFGAEAGRNGAAAPRTQGREPASMLEAEFERQQEDWIARFDRELQATVFAARFSLRTVIAHRSQQRGELIAAMRSAAQKILASIQRELSIRCWQSGQGEDERARESQLRTCIASAAPALLRAGGALRTMVLVPRTVDASRLVSEINRLTGREPAAVSLDDSGIIVLNEGEQLPLDQVLGLLMRLDPQCCELAQRLHTRTDIDWRLGRQFKTP